MYLFICPLFIYGYFSVFMCSISLPPLDVILIFRHNVQFQMYSLSLYVTATGHHSPEGYLVQGEPVSIRE